MVNGIEINYNYIQYCIYIYIIYIYIKLYRSFNSLHSKCYKFCETVLLQLVSVYCIPFLLYGMEAVSSTKSELNSLEYTYSSAVCKIFKVSHSSVAFVLHIMH